ncbi:TPA: hypothetical protein ACWLUJ_006136 [Pseudomonas aeruginosa]|nr:hypothetical protein [Pseudomonas aeruginosa]HEJ2342342.1 hypothetical protein [Pseudomonas aeruginosa]
MQKFTVISQSAGQTVSYHVYAENALNAFATAAAMNDNLTMVVALPGWQEEDQGAFFPGDGPVDSNTALEQPEVFGSPVCEVTESAITDVLREYSLRVSNSRGHTFEEMAKDLIEDLDAYEIIHDAFQKVPEDANATGIEQALFVEIHAALVREGTLEF